MRENPGGLLNATPSRIASQTDFADKAMQQQQLGVAYAAPSESYVYRHDKACVLPRHCNNAKLEFSTPLDLNGLTLNSQNIVAAKQIQEHSCLYED